MVCHSRGSSPRQRAVAFSSRNSRDFVSVQMVHSSCFSSCFEWSGYAVSCWMYGADDLYRMQIRAWKIVAVAEHCEAIPLG